MINQAQKSFKKTKNQNEEMEREMSTKKSEIIAIKTTLEDTKNHIAVLASN